MISVGKLQAKIIDLPGVFGLWILHKKVRVQGVVFVRNRRRKITDFGGIYIGSLDHFQCDKGWLELNFEERKGVTELSKRLLR